MVARRRQSSSRRCAVQVGCHLIPDNGLGAQLPLAKHGFAGFVLRI